MALTQRVTAMRSAIERRLRLGAPAAHALARDAHRPVPAGHTGPRLRAAEDPLGRAHHVLGADQEGRPDRRRPRVGPHGRPGRRRHEPRPSRGRARHRRLTGGARPGLVPIPPTQRKTLMTTNDQLPRSPVPRLRGGARRARAYRPDPRGRTGTPRGHSHDVGARRGLGCPLFPDPGWSPGASFWTHLHPLPRSALMYIL